MSVTQLRTLYAENDGGHYFDADTLKFFGSTNTRAERIGDRWMYSEQQTEAPCEELSWRAATFTSDGYGPLESAAGRSRLEAIAATLSLAKL